MSDPARMSLTKRIRAVMDAPSDRLDDLVKASGIDPASDLQFGDWRGLNLINADLRRFNFTGADLTGARFDGARIAGAIFDHARYDLASLYKAQDVICFTAKRRLIALEANATGVDLANTLQPESPIASAIKINGKNAPITSILKNGDQVEIVTQKTKSGKTAQEKDGLSRERLSSLRVGRSRSGLGLFATEPIKEGAFIAEFTGQLMSHSDSNFDMVENRYLFEVNGRWTIDGSSRSNIARYINHSCRPNAEVYIRNRRVKIRAAKNIKPSEEIVYDYGEDYFNVYIKPVGCKCAKCIKNDRERSELFSSNANRLQRTEGKLPQVTTGQSRQTSKIDRKRRCTMKKLARRERVDLRKVSKSLYRSYSGDLSAVCTFSKRYERTRARYWYGYSPDWKKFLSQSPRSFLVLGCIDREVAYAIPKTVINRVSESAPPRAQSALAHRSGGIQA